MLKGIEENMLQGEKIRLRIVTHADLALIEAWANDLRVHSEYGDFGLRRSGGFEQAFADDGLLGARLGELMIVLPNDEVVGLVSYHQVGYGPNEGSRAYNIGISIHEEHRGKGYGVEAQRLLAEYLFLTYSIKRVEATTDIENTREHRALEKAGFTREGVLRQAQWRLGNWHDMVVYSKLRGE
jgi:RimJ/RimL family protein N-acetyltransferase